MTKNHFCQNWQIYYDPNPVSPLNITVKVVYASIYADKITHMLNNRHFNVIEKKKIFGGGGVAQNFISPQGRQILSLRHCVNS